MNKKHISVHIITILALVVIFCLNYLWIGSIRPFSSMELAQMVLISLSVILLDGIICFTITGKEKIDQFLSVVVSNSVTALYFVFQVIMCFIVPFVHISYELYITLNIIFGFLLFSGYALVFLAFRKD